VSNSESELLRERYGLNPKPVRIVRNRVLAIAGVGLLTAGVAVITAITFSPVSHQDISFQTSDWQTEIEFEVSRPVGSTVECDLQALNEQFAVVGFKTIEIPASERRQDRYRVTINTTHLATTGLVSECRLK
jgi:hypothetical protein